MWVQEETEAEKQTNYKERMIFSSQMLKTLLHLDFQVHCMNLTALQLKDILECVYFNLTMPLYLQGVTHYLQFIKASC